MNVRTRWREEVHVPDSFDEMREAFTLHSTRSGRALRHRYSIDGIRVGYSAATRENRRIWWDHFYPFDSFSDPLEGTGIGFHAHMLSLRALLEEPDIFPEHRVSHGVTSGSRTTQLKRIGIRNGAQLSRWIARSQGYAERHGMRPYILPVGGGR